MAIDFPPVDRFTYITLGPRKHLVVDCRHHLVVATCEAKYRARELAALLTKTEP